jgi:hypothetical protein
VTLLVFTALFTFVLLLFGRRGAAVRGGARLRHEIDALYSGEHEYRQVTPADFPYADISFYDRVQRELEALGFRRVADIEDLTLSRVYPESRTFVRVLVDDAALIRAGAFHLRPRGGLVGLFSAIGVIPRHIHVVELVTELPRGRFLVTAPTRGLDRLDPPPEAQVERLPPSTTTRALVERHRERVAAHLRAHAGHSPVPMDGYDSVVASVQRGHVAASRHRQKIGRLSKDELERMTGQPLDDEESAMLSEVQRKTPGDGAGP